MLFVLVSISMPAVLSLHRAAAQLTFVCNHYWGLRNCAGVMSGVWLSHACTLWSKLAQTILPVQKKTVQELCSCEECKCVNACVRTFASSFCAVFRRTTYCLCSPELCRTVLWLCGWLWQWMKHLKASGLQRTVIAIGFLSLKHACSRNHIWIPRDD